MARRQQDDGFSRFWPEDSASLWWLFVGFLGGVASVTVVSALLLLEAAA